MIHLLSRSRALTEQIVDASPFWASHRTDHH